MLGDAEAHVEADEVRQLERAHGVAVAELERGVDVLGAGDALLDHADRLETEHEAQAARGEARRVLHDDARLAHLLADGARGRDRLLGGLLRLDDLEQLHQVHGVEEVHPDHLVGA